MMNHDSLVEMSRFALCVPIVCHFVINVKMAQSNVAVGIARLPNIAGPTCQPPWLML